MIIELTEHDRDKGDKFQAKTYGEDGEIMIEVYGWYNKGSIDIIEFCDYTTDDPEEYPDNDLIDQILKEVAYQSKGQDKELPNYSNYGFL